MTIHLDHTIVPARDATAAARQLAELLDVPWGVAAVGPFVALYLNEGLTLDFQDTEEDFPVYHHCFRVTPRDFDAILGRLQERGIAWRSDVRGPIDHRVGTHGGGRNVYWNEPEGHQWEMLTVSYARMPNV